MAKMNPIQQQLLQNNVIANLNKLSFPNDQAMIQAAIVVSRFSSGDNLQVGCLIAEDDHVISVGWRTRDLLATRDQKIVHTFRHAEDLATLNMPSLKGKTVYVTLEPCSDRGVDIEPCAERLKRLTPERVVFAAYDEQHLAKTGKQCMATRILTEAGIPVSRVMFEGLIITKPKLR